MQTEALLDPPRDRPVLPEDRARAFNDLETLNQHFADAESMARATGLPWAHRILARPQSSTSVEAIMRACEVAISGLRDLERHLDTIHAPGKAPLTLAEAMDHLAALVALTEDHRSASIASATSMVPEERLLAIVEECRHFARCRTKIREALEGDLPMEEANGFVLAGGEAADTLRDEFGCETLEAVDEAIDALERQTVVIEGRVRRLMVLPARLDLPDITLGEIARIAAACGAAGDLPEEVRQRLSEAAPEVEHVIVAARDKAAKILNAATLLDESIGKAWRQEPLDKIAKVLKLCEIPGHPSHAKISAYVRSIGIGAHVRSHLDAIVKTRAGMSAFDTDASLKRLIPRSFAGLSTDFAPLMTAFSARRGILEALEELPCADRVIAAICSSSTVVAAEFISLSALGADVVALQMPAETRLDAVRLSHADKIGRLRQCRQAIRNMPVKDDLRTPADARRLSRLIREADGTHSRILANQDFLDSGSRSPDELLTAFDWQTKLSGLVEMESMPKGDHAFAQLHVHARSARAAAEQTAAAMAHLATALPSESMPTVDLAIRDGLSKLEDIMACEPVLHAQVLNSECMNGLFASDLRPFIDRMNSDGVRSHDWRSRLEEDYALLDRLVAEDAAMESLSMAASDAAPAQIVPDDMGGQAVEEVPPFDDDSWDEGEFQPIPAMSLERVVDADPLPAE